MFKIIDSTIHCSRGDGGTIVIKIPITDSNGNIKYEDDSSNVYWYNTKTHILYDSSYTETNISINMLSIVFYKFQVGDKITFNIYNKNGYNKDPLMVKEVTIMKITDTVYVSLGEEDTTFCDSINKPTIFWYDVTLNDYMTVICYNEDGAKEFILYPAKGEAELQEFQASKEEQENEDDNSDDIDYNSIIIVDNLESSSIYDALSANQGRILKQEICNSGIVESAIEPTGDARKKVWIQNTGVEQKIYIKNENNVYEEFYKNEDTGWVDLSTYINSNVVSIREGFTPMARKINNVVYFRGELHISTETEINTFNILEGLPSSLMPTYQATGSGITYLDCIPYSIWAENSEIRVCIKDTSVQEPHNGFDLCNIAPYIVD